MGQLLETRCVALIKNAKGSMLDPKPDWLQISFVNAGIKLVRRQELPAEASVPAEQAAELVHEHYKVSIISHGWLDPGHPDPLCKRRADAEQIDYPYVFWDFLSLYQADRTDDQKRAFKLALGNMHLFYTNRCWPVFRFVAVPEGSTSFR